MFTDVEKTNILSDLIKIKSVNDNELEVANYIDNLFKKHDVKSKVLPITKTRANLVAEIGSGSPVFGWSGHMDVVSVPNEKDWTYNPFELTESDEKLFGRGTSDMKSGLAAMVIAMIELKEEKAEIPGTIRLMATIGEEVGGEGSQKFMDDDYMKDIDALLIGEPSSHQIIYSHKGSLDITLESKGTASHSSMPELGFNAIDPLVNIIKKANDNFRNSEVKNDLLGKLTFNSDIINGGDQVNSIPDNAKVEINVRTIPEYSSKQVIEQLQEIIDEENKNGSKVELTVDMDELPVSSPKDSNLANIVSKIAEEKLKLEIKRTPIAGVTDASHFLEGKDENFPFVMFGPGVLEMAHKTNEYVYKSDYLNCINIYKDVAKNYK